MMVMMMMIIIIIIINIIIIIIIIIMVKLYLYSRCIQRRVRVYVVFGSLSSRKVELENWRCYYCRNRGSIPLRRSTIWALFQ